MEFNPADIMKNFTNIQKQMKDVKGKLKEVKANGTSGGGLVKVVINGEMEIEQIKLDPIVVDSRDIEMLQDLIIAAINGAHNNVKEKIEKEVSGKTGIKMPFDLDGFK